MNLKNNLIMIERFIVMVGVSDFVIIDIGDVFFVVYRGEM